MGLGKTVQVSAFCLALFHKTGSSVDAKNNRLKRRNGSPEVVKNSARCANISWISLLHYKQ
jgi:hypothetical protein